MSPRHAVASPTLEDRVFLALVIAVSLAFAWIVRPLAGAILWGTAIAVIFAPLQRRLVRSLRERRSLAALATMAVVLVLVVLPVTAIAVALVNQGMELYTRLQSGDVNVGRYVQQVIDALPQWAVELVNRYLPTSVAELQARLSGLLSASARFLASQALNLGQYTLDFAVSLFVMLYLLFFLLRDGDVLARRITGAIPLRPELRQSLAARFATVIRATIKGTVVVAVVQGALGGLIFWVLGIEAAVLWGALMALLSLVPAVGPALVWLPVAVYLVATGRTWAGIGLAAYGALVIGTVDNVLRPILVGKDTRMPDYVVLVSTLGGLAVVGLNGFVIGPVIAAMFLTVWQIFADSRATERREPVVEVMSERAAP